MCSWNTLCPGDDRVWLIWHKGQCQGHKVIHVYSKGQRKRRWELTTGKQTIKHTNRPTGQKQCASTFRSMGIQMQTDGWNGWPVLQQDTKDEDVNLCQHQRKIWCHRENNHDELKVLATPSICKSQLRLCGPCLLVVHVAELTSDSVNSQASWKGWVKEKVVKSWYIHVCNFTGFNIGAY